MKFKLLLAILLVSLLAGVPGLAVDVSDVQAAGNNIERVSVSDNGTQGNSISAFPSISTDGRYVAFESWASNLVPNDTNGSYDIFVRDTQTNTTIRVSVASDGTQGNGGSNNPCISDDGRYVAFESSSNNLVPNDQNKTNDIFFRDRQTNTTTLISISDNGTQGNGGSNSPCISDDGRYVAFDSIASNLVPDDANGGVFIRDRQTNTTTRVSISDNGTPANGGCFCFSISDDGRYVAFLSYADNLVPDDTNGEGDIFVRDRQLNTTTRVNVASDGTQANHSTGHASISDDGRYVTFFSFASNLVPNDTNEQSDVFVRDRQLNTTTRVSVASDGAQGNGGSNNPCISDDGRYVAFEAYDGNLVPGETNGYQDILVHDCQTGATARVSVSDNGIQGNGDSLYPAINDDGRFITFFSDASNLVPNDTNGVQDVFIADNPLYEQLPTSASVASATGTGTITIGTSSGGIQSLTAVSQDELLCGSLPDSVSFPHGLLSFTIVDIPPGSIITITITFPESILEGVQYWECLNGTWVDYTSLVGDDDGDEILTLNIIDGGLGDGDGQINGEISDPGGPAILAPAAAPVSATPHASPALHRQLNQAQISLQYLSVNPQQVATNQPLTITGNVVNTGDQAGNYNLALKINGKVEQTRMVSVGPQATQPVKFTVAKSEPGIYRVDIGGQTVSFTILGASRNGSSTSGGGLLAILIIGIMILATTVVLLINRRTA